MSLQGSRIVYLFMDTADLGRQQRFFQAVLGMPLLEADPRLPRARHAVLKFDAGSTIVALNRADPRAFRADLADGAVTVLAAAKEGPVRARLAREGIVPPAGGGSFPDGDGHRYALARGAGGGPGRARACGLRLRVRDPAAAAAFYHERLGFTVRPGRGAGATVVTGNLPVVLEPAAPGEGPFRPGAFVVGLHTPGLLAACAALEERGVPFRRPPRFTEIGGTAHFSDPDGHAFCLYEPSDQCLDQQPSGRKVREILRASRTRGEPSVTFG